MASEKEKKLEKDLENLIASFTKLNSANYPDFDKQFKPAKAKMVDLGKESPILGVLYGVLMKRPAFAVFVGNVKEPPLDLGTSEGMADAIRLFFQYEAANNENFAKEAGHLLAVNFETDGALSTVRLLSGALLYFRRVDKPKANLFYDEKAKKPFIYVKDLVAQPAGEVKPEKVTPPEEIKKSTPVKAGTGDLYKDALAAFKASDKVGFESNLNKASEETLDKLFWKFYTGNVYKDGSYLLFIQKSPKYKGLAKGKIKSDIEAGKVEIFNKEENKAYIINSAREWLKMGKMDSPKVTTELLLNLYDKFAPKKAEEKKQPAGTMLNF